MAYFPGSNCLIECGVIGILRGIDGIEVSSLVELQLRMEQMMTTFEVALPVDFSWIRNL
jgi:hypothetical protein